MIECYLQLREMGHGIKKSIKVSIDDLVQRYCPFPYCEPLEIQLEKALKSLEKEKNPDFQSLSDATNLPIDKETFRGGYYTKVELNLSKLHLHYCQDRSILSPKQTKRYEALLKNLPGKFHELLESIETGGTEGLGEYEYRKGSIIDERRKSWKEHKKRNSDNKY